MDTTDVLGHSDNVQETRSELLAHPSAVTGLARSSREIWYELLVQLSTFSGFRVDEQLRSHDDRPLDWPFIADMLSPVDMAAGMFGRSDDAQELWTGPLIQPSADTGSASGSEATRLDQRA